ncbi:MAG: DNA-processing protein DprA [Actinobacteria bacterium]|nr:DNA-processing protein DprA [Actinomycetota bacterium]
MRGSVRVRLSAPPSRDPRPAARTLPARGGIGGAPHRPAVAVVGARACSSYGRQVARTLGGELAAAGLVVVSGLARGIDGEAHRGALEAGGLTVAVLGCGIDRDYPTAHRPLAHEVAASGLIVSEYAPGVEPAPWRFPARKCGGPAAKPFRLKQAVVSAVAAVKCAPRVVPVWSRKRATVSSPS